MDISLVAQVGTDNEDSPGKQLGWVKVAIPAVNKPMAGTRTLDPLFILPTVVGALFIHEPRLVCASEICEGGIVIKCPRFRT